MNIIKAILLMAFSHALVAETVIWPTFPGTNIPDKTKPAMVKDGNVIYETYPGIAVRDYNRPAHVIQDNGNGTSTIYETFPPGNIPNKMNGGYTIENRN